MARQSLHSDQEYVFKTPIDTDCDPVDVVLGDEVETMYLTDAADHLDNKEWTGETKV